MPKRPAKRTPAKTTRRKPKRVPPDGLNDRERRFVDEYLLDLNATKAAERAGYSSKTARAQGSRLLTRVAIQAAVEAGMENRQQRTEVDQDRVIHETALLAFSDVTHYILGDDGQVRLAEGAPRDAMRAVSSIKRKTRSYTYADGSESVTRDIELKLWNKPEPLKLAGRHVGLFPNEVKVDMGEQTMAGLLALAHEYRNRRNSERR